MDATVLIYSSLFRERGNCVNVKFDIWLVYTHKMKIACCLCRPANQLIFLCFHSIVAFMRFPRRFAPAFVAPNVGPSASLLAPNVGPDPGLSPRLRQLMRTFDWTVSTEHWTLEMKRDRNSAALQLDYHTPTWTLHGGRNSFQCQTARG